LTIRRAIPAAIVILAIVIAAAFALPRTVPQRPFVETTVWSLLVAASFVGWGSLVAFFVARKERIDLGLRMAWGAGVFIAVGGFMVVPSALGRTEQTVLVEIGLALAIAAAVHDRERIRFRALFFGRFARKEPRIFALVLFALAIVALHYSIGISENHTNPYDDDIAYLPFVKKLLQTGTFLEPFSFRRLSALGGQTLFVSLLRLHSAPPQSNAFDRSVCVLLITLLVVGYRNRGRRAPYLAIIVVMGMLFTLPLTAINTASYYSGVAFFLALFRTMTWAGARERKPWQSGLPLALVAATTMTLRQNYLPVPVFAFAASYGFRLWKQRSLKSLIEPLWTAGLTLAFVVPWMVLSYQSNQTFLYPIMAGTFNRALALESTDWGFLREAKLNVWTFIEGTPSRAVGFVIIAAACLREKATRRPLLAYAIGAAGGFAAVVHGLTGSDAGNIGRYVFGATAAFVLATVLAAGTERANPKRAQLALGIAVVGCAVQIAFEKEEFPIYKFYNHGFEKIEQLSHEPPALEHTLEPPEFFLYGRLQNSIPAGQRFAILLDEPYHLDYGRNPIWNIDMPGYSSPAPGMPFFQGSDKVEAYFKQIGVRYIAYVKPEYSRYHYRRDYWLEVLVDELEMWRAFAPYLIDFLDTLKAMTDRHRVLFEERGLVVIDLESPK
jgi:hypothetical protein